MTSNESLGPDVREIFEAISAGVTELARSTLGGALIEAKYDVKNFLELIKDDLVNWTGDLASGKVSPGDFSKLVKTKQSQAEMKLLVEAGMPSARIEHFKDGVVDLICRTVESRLTRE